MAKLILFFKVFFYRFKENKLSVSAGYLTYSTLLAIVPLIMVAFSIVTAFPMFEELSAELKSFIYHNFAPNAGDVVQEYIDNFVSNSRQMSAVGVVGLIAVALLLIYSIDNTLNDMWHNTQTRSLFVSFAIYWMILTLWPLFAGLSYATNAYLHSLELFQSEADSGSFSPLQLLPFVLTWFLFSVIYVVVPNTKVAFKHAAIGALLAAFFFTLGKQIFVWYVTTFPSYQAIYGTLAVLPIMIMWIHLSWMAILLGAQFTAVLKDMAEIARGESQLPLFTKQTEAVDDRADSAR